MPATHPSAVEDRETCELLRAHGCDLAQGYHVAAPMPADAVSGWIEDWAAGLTFIRRAEIGAGLIERDSSAVM